MRTPAACTRARPLGAGPSFARLAARGARRGRRRRALRVSRWLSRRGVHTHACCGSAHVTRSGARVPGRPRPRAVLRQRPAGGLTDRNYSGSGIGGASSSTALRLSRRCGASCRFGVRAVSVSARSRASRVPAPAAQALRPLAASAPTSAAMKSGGGVLLVSMLQVCAARRLAALSSRRSAGLPGRC